MIQTRAYDDALAEAVFRRLDVNDHIEAEMALASSIAPLALWANWRAVQGICAASFVLLTAPNAGARPFAVAQLVATGQGGVVSGAFLARNHAQFQRPIAEAVALIRMKLPAFCQDHGIRRIETRCWAGHPTASRLLEHLGFTLETDMPGFGPNGAHVFRQFARTFPASEQRN